MALNKRELWSNDINIASFPPKSPSGWGLRPQTPICNSFELHLSAQYVSWITLFYFGLSLLPIAKSWLWPNTQATAIELPIHHILVPQKVPLSKSSDDVIACVLWFEPP